jgi:Xaa-Pro dipeptidase
LDGLVIGSGSLEYYCEDDAAVVFRPYHHFTHWCPATGEGHLLHIRPGQKPVLYHFSPADYWHEHTALSDSYWTEDFEIKALASEDAVWAAVKGLKNTGYLGPDKSRAEAAGLKVDPAGVLPRLNWERSFKSEYEVKCVEKATRRAAKGHVAAKEAFLAGGSELDIHLAFLRAIRGTEESLPYPTITCLNEKAAVLHYHRKRDKVRGGKTFLIDAGTRHRGYACDITRTYAADVAPDAFRSLLLAMQSMQKTLCTMLKPGVSYEFLHARAHLDIGQILLDHGILKGVTKEQALELGLTGPFFPHGLGHLLGILVHDVAGKQADRLGTPAQVNPKFKYLRTNRILDAGNLITVEPGLYFIEMLLAPFREGEHRAKLDWPLIDSLMKCGGIRVEDDVLVTRSGARNLTREALFV